MKKLLFIICYLMCVIAVNAEIHTYVKCAGSIEQYANELANDTAEILIVFENDNSMQANILNHYSDTINKISNSYFVQKIDNHTIRCDDSYSFMITGQDEEYYCISKSGKYLKIGNYSVPNVCYIYGNNGSGNFGITIYKESSNNYHYCPIKYEDDYFKCPFVRSDIESTKSLSSTFHIYRKINANDSIAYDDPANDNVIHDTLYISVPVISYIYDTVRDTVTVTNIVEVHDTIEITLTDTIEITLTDTITVTELDTIYFECDGTGLIYALDEMTVYYSNGEIVNTNGIKIKLYSADGKLVETSYTNISMADKPHGFYIVTDGNGGYLKIIY